MKTIGLLATPSNANAIMKYIALFNGSDRDAAELGHSKWYTLLTCEDVQTFYKEHNVAPGAQIVALTVAGMTWNLSVKEAEIDRGIRNKRETDLWLEKIKLENEANGIK